MASGIYTITCTVTNKVYVGSAVDFGARRRVHLHGLRNGKHHSTKLQRAFSKYGESTFEFTLIRECQKADLIAEEQRMIDSLKPWFNSNPIAGSRLGSRATAATRERLRISHLGYKPSIESLAKHKLAMQAYAADPAVRDRLATAALGRKQSPEEIKKRSDAVRGMKRNEDSKETMRRSQRTRRGVTVNEQLVLDAYRKQGSVRAVSRDLGLGRKLVKGIVDRGGVS